MYTILVVDDSPFIVDVFVTMLERGGYRTVAAYGGEECIEILKTVTPDLILLDIMMSPINGWDFLEKLRGEYNMREIPVILFTASPSIDEKIALLKDPHLGVLVKPVSFAQLKTEIERYLV